MGPPQALSLASPKSPLGSLSPVLLSPKGAFPSAGASQRLTQPPISPRGTLTNPLDTKVGSTKATANAATYSFNSPRADPLLGGHAPARPQRPPEFGGRRQALGAATSEPATGSNVRRRSSAGSTEISDTRRRSRDETEAKAGEEKDDLGDETTRRATLFSAEKESTGRARAKREVAMSIRTEMIIKMPVLSQHAHLVFHAALEGDVQGMELALTDEKGTRSAVNLLRDISNFTRTGVPGVTKQSVTVLHCAVLSKNPLAVRYLLGIIREEQNAILKESLQKLDRQRQVFIAETFENVTALGKFTNVPQTDGGKPNARLLAQFTSLRTRAERFGAWLEGERRKCHRLAEIRCELAWRQSVSARDSSGRTVLHYAAAQKGKKDRINDDMIETLFKAGRGHMSAEDPSLSYNDVAILACLVDNIEKGRSRAAITYDIRHIPSQKAGTTSTKVSAPLFRPGVNYCNLTGGVWAPTGIVDEAPISTVPQSKKENFTSKKNNHSEGRTVGGGELYNSSSERPSPQKLAGEAAERRLQQSNPSPSPNPKQSAHIHNTNTYIHNPQSNQNTTDDISSSAWYSSVGKIGAGAVYTLKSEKMRTGPAAVGIFLGKILSRACKRGVLRGRDMQEALENIDVRLTLSDIDILTQAFEDNTYTSKTEKYIDHGALIECVVESLVVTKQTDHALISGTEQSGLHVKNLQSGSEGPGAGETLHVNLQSVLGARKAVLDIRDNNGLTALCYASSSGNIGAVRTLTAYGASQSIADDNGHTVVSLCATDAVRSALVGALRYTIGKSGTRMYTVHGHEEDLTKIVGMVAEAETLSQSPSRRHHTQIRGSRDRPRTAPPRSSSHNAPGNSTINYTLNKSFNSMTMDMNSTGSNFCDMKRSLHLAAASGLPEGVRDLLERSEHTAKSTSSGTGSRRRYTLPILNEVDANGWTALHHCCHGYSMSDNKNAYSMCARILIEEGGASVTAVTSSGKTPLHLIAGGHNQSTAVGETLRTVGETFNKNVNLHAGTETGDLVALLLKHGASLECRDRKGYTPLHCCAIGGGSGAMWKLLSAGADVLSVTPGGSTALHLSVVHNHIQTAKLLCVWDSDTGTLCDMLDKQGRKAKELARSDEMSRALTTLWSAAVSGDLGALANAVAPRDRSSSAGWQCVDDKSPRLGMSPLHWALVGMAAKNRGLDLAYCRKRGGHPAPPPVIMNILNTKKTRNDAYADIILLLINKLHCNIDSLDIRCRTSLMLAASAEAVGGPGGGTLEVLLDRGASSEKQDLRGNTALHYAYAFASARAIEILEREGGGMGDKLNWRNKTPIEEAGAGYEIVPPLPKNCT